MRATETLGRWLRSDGWFDGVCLHDRMVSGFRPDAAGAKGPLFIPAPLDLHVHGGGGADVMQGDEALRTVLHTHARHGTAGLLATSVTAPLEAIDDFLASVARVAKQLELSTRDSQAGDESLTLSGARLLGVHLEGPFISPDKLGAQPNFPAPLDLAKLETWFKTGLVKVITYAPELDPGTQVPGLCQRYGVRAQIGHTLCSWAQAAQAMAAGAGVTHLYNAMSPVLHRGGGAAVAALAYATHAEVITDGIHVDKAAFDAARRSIDGLYSITDATAAAGMPDGEYQLGSLTISKTGHRVELPDGTLAGSCLTQQRSVQVLRGWGLSWAEIAGLSSTVPAQWLQRTDYGLIAPEAHASWLEINNDEPDALWLNGIRHTLETLP
ncbi:N-acetylglucosamine-6-phosphate deacetylase [Granulosicoccus antarcticus]|uniref:N-acetylglucosamine-6-phosphate deacetylase n=1 Tax=Granulosicoccus antarcticus IMCC3135 TaxID=1192854 RepID=A0A2Z2NGY1_9GAMM|nr:N-acetylglucosamine-6-phosphate deacetylase [Granulosicoccus antarcticus]ASJ70389.1 N-acetylglucosamine-6-phosphate deacetylase [Granulosicoccus antarcticus IMCC3135]